MGGDGGAGCRGVAGCMQIVAGRGGPLDSRYAWHVAVKQQWQWQGEPTGSDMTVRAIGHRTP